MPDRRLGYCKLCELADFRDPDLRALIRDMADCGDDRPDFPDGEEHRKDWEIAMSARALRDLGALRPDAEILGIGAGQERTIFWLTRHVRRVFATDLYLTDDSWSARDSGAGMLVEPEKHAQIAWNPGRLVVQHMNALELRYEDESFDGIFSSGSIEHFGELPDIRRSIEEMYRVLKPGGVAAVATEYRLEGPPPGLPGTVLFDEAELRQVLFDGMDWEPASPLDTSISEETMSAPVEFDSLFRHREPTFTQKLRDLLGLEVEFEVEHVPTPYPHIVVRKDPYLWTSVHVAFVKPPRDLSQP